MPKKKKGKGGGGKKGKKGGSAKAKADDADEGPGEYTEADKAKDADLVQRCMSMGAEAQDLAAADATQQQQQQQQQQEEAIAQYEAVRQLSNQIRDDTARRKVQAMAAASIADVYDALQDYVKSVNHLKQARSIARGDREIEEVMLRQRYKKGAAEKPETTAGGGSAHSAGTTAPAKVAAVTAGAGHAEEEEGGVFEKPKLADLLDLLGPSLETPPEGRARGLQLEKTYARGREEWYWGRDSEEWLRKATSKAPGVRISNGTEPSPRHAKVVVEVSAPYNKSAPQDRM